MVTGLHQPVVDIVHRAIDMMDDLMRDKIDVQEYARCLKTLDADSLLATYRQDFRQNPKMVYYLDALMIISSLQHELDFQVAEYGVNVASEDIKMLKELLPKFENLQS
jgi:hypothetical protein